MTAGTGAVKPLPHLECRGKRVKKMDESMNWIEGEMQHFSGGCKDAKSASEDLQKCWGSYVPLKMCSGLLSPTGFPIWQRHAHVNMRPLPDPTAWTTEPGKTWENKFGVKVSRFPNAQSLKDGLYTEPFQPKKWPLLQWWMHENRIPML